MHWMTPTGSNGKFIQRPFGIGLIVILCGIFTLSLAISAVKNIRLMVITPNRAEGIVVSDTQCYGMLNIPIMRWIFPTGINNISRCPVIEFEYAEKMTEKVGRVRFISYSFAYLYDEYPQKGDKIAVRYNENNPQIVEITSFPKVIPTDSIELFIMLIIFYFLTKRWLYLRRQHHWV